MYMLILNMYADMYSYVDTNIVGNQISNFRQWTKEY